MVSSMTALLSSPDFPTPIEDRYFEDYVTGSVYEYGSITVSQAEILEFASRFDPQPMHTDPDAARAGPFGGLIASGWHTAAVMMRLLVDHYLSKVAGLASPGIDELRWLRPVRPGDSLRVRLTIVETRLSRSRSDRGMVRTAAEVLNQDGDVVMTLTAMNLVRTRDGG
jgi:acyl dehydratase